MISLLFLSNLIKFKLVVPEKHAHFQESIKHQFGDFLSNQLRIRRIQLGSRSNDENPAKLLEFLHLKFF